MTELIPRNTSGKKGFCNALFAEDGITTPIALVDLTTRFRALTFGWYPNSFMILRTFCFVASPIRGLSAITLDTVDGETPLFLATSLMVTIFIPAYSYNPLANR